MVQEVRAALQETGVAAIGRASSASPEAFDFLAVDVLDALLSTADEPLRARYVEAIRRFAKRGPRELRRATIALDGPGA